MTAGSEPFVLQLQGEWDISVYPRLQALLQLPSEAKLVLVNMSETSYVDSFSLSEIALTIRRWESEGRRTAVLAGAKMYRMLSMTSMIERLHVFASAEEAHSYLTELRGQDST